MPTKLPQKTYPDGHGPEDFQCFGPAATKDTEFVDTMIADLGCFAQENGKDSNKYYHGAVVQSKINQRWYPYFEWARQGVKNPAFLFINGCSSREEAVKEYVAQLNSKNTKRGRWEEHPALGKRLLPRINSKGEPDDLYSVRPQATRSTGLPDAKTIQMNEGQKVSGIRSASIKVKVDTQTLDLMKAINVGTVNYTRSAMSGSALPTQAAIDEARLVLGEAQKTVQKVGEDIEDQVADKDMMSLTRLLYSRIPKIKNRSDGPEKWMLSGNNIAQWYLDLDAFESALYANTNTQAVESDPFGGMKIKMRWLDRKSPAGQFLYSWFPQASRNVHANMGTMRIHNVWEIEREGDIERVTKRQKQIAADRFKITESPFSQEYYRHKRLDLSQDEASLFEQSHTFLGIHGTRSVNVRGLLDKSWRLPSTLVGVKINAWMFGPGIYWADDWRKSAQYTSLGRARYTQSDSGNIRGREGFMFLADVPLGSCYVPREAEALTSAPHNYHSVCGKMGYTRGRGGQLLNNEFITYHGDVRMRYLIELSA